MKTLIKNGRVVTAVDDYKADILIEDERISVIGASLQMEVDQTVDAAGNPRIEFLDENGKVVARIPEK